MNLGSPDSTEVKDVRKYLNEFLMDERVIDYPKLFRILLVKGIIVPFRSPKSAEAYRSIWTDEGSPLIVLTKQLKNALSNMMPDDHVEIAMRYGNPSVKFAFDQLKGENIDQVLAIPLYPHYAMSSYETAVAYAQKIYNSGNYPFSLEFIKPYYDDEKYIHALSESIKPYWTDEYDHILFSYHGVPERHIRKGDVTGCHCLKVENCCSIPSAAHTTCYRHHCHITTELVTAKIGIPKEKYTMSFQSRLGKEEWLKPYTIKKFETLPKQGIKRLLVVCPAFVSDCLETLEEIAEEGKHEFMKAGGEKFTMIPCLNDNRLWVETLKHWSESYFDGAGNMLLNEQYV